MSIFNGLMESIRLNIIIQKKVITIINYENPKEYLRSLRALDIYIEQKQEELKELKTRADSISVDYSSERVQTSAYGDGIPDLVIKILKLEKNINDQIDIFLDTRHKIINDIQRLTNDVHVRILYKRYVQYKPLEQIAFEMSYSYRQILRLHGRALQNFKRCHTMSH